ncbi:hypothetical protein QMA0440_03375 [Yersinia ruckeri]|nr:hypothetical protein QMA0440_03375 [Yersinia ruckeri]KFE38762.1 hypothetical protein nADLYRO1b_1813 [Yersinia ruckeri]
MGKKKEKLPQEPISSIESDLLAVLFQGQH